MANSDRSLAGGQEMILHASDDDRAAALRYLTRTGNEDVAEMLGLTGADAAPEPADETPATPRMRPRARMVGGSRRGQ